jgi:hypothetical protein
MSSNGPNVGGMLATWFGGDSLYPDWGIPINFGAASNLIFGNNPVYQISDFLAIYPKYGTYAQSIVAVTVANGGSGYAVGNPLTPVQPDSSGAVITVTAVNGNAVSAVTVSQPGTGYSVANDVPTTTNGNGTGCTLNITQLLPPNLLVPLGVIQLYLNLASACLQEARWADYWPAAMGWFIDHFLTLYLRSNGNVGNTAGQVAQAGLSFGVTVSKSAGDVSVGYESIQSQLDGFAQWNLTLSGQMLASIAKILGMGFMYVP